MVAWFSNDRVLHTPFNVRRNYLIHDRFVELGKYGRSNQPTSW